MLDTPIRRLGGVRVPRCGREPGSQPGDCSERSVLSTGASGGVSVLFPCRGKGCRTITFEQFKEALEELSKKRFKDKSSEEAVREVHGLIEGKAPIISGVTVSEEGLSGSMAPEA